MPFEQANEQNKETVKGSGGAVGLTENPAALKRWMVVGPEQARFLTELRSSHSLDQASQNHEQEYST